MSTNKTTMRIIMGAPLTNSGPGLGLACGCVVILAILAALAFIGFVVFA